MTHHLWHEKSAIGSDSGLNNLKIFNRGTHQEISKIFLVGVSASKLVVLAVPSRRKHQQSSLRTRSLHRLFKFLAEPRGCAEVAIEIICHESYLCICIDRSHVLYIIYMVVCVIDLKHQIPAWAKSNCQGCQQWHWPSQARFAVNNDLCSWFKHIQSNVWRALESNDSSSL